MEEFILNEHPQPDGTSGRSRVRGGGIATPAKSDVAAHTVGEQDLTYSATVSYDPLGAAVADSVRLYPGFASESRPSSDEVPGDQPVFLTWMLHRSLPEGYALPGGESVVWQDFVTVDRLLDEARSGPLYLGRREVAAMVVGTLVAYGTALRQYDLHAYVVMPNHIHLLLTPRVELRKMAALVRSVTAGLAGEMLGQPGAPFWSEARCEYAVASPHELSRIRQYIEGSPVPAGIVREAEDYPFSSAGRKAFAQPA